MSLLYMFLLFYKCDLNNETPYVIWQNFFNEDIRGQFCIRYSRN